MTSELHREALLRQTKATGKHHDVLKNDNNIGRSLQIFEVTECLESNVNELKWFCSVSQKMSTSTHLQHNLSIKLSNHLLRAPYSGLISQMVFYSCHLSLPEVQMQFRGKTFTLYLSMMIWILCTSDVNQLLTFIFGLYDIDNDNIIDIDSLCALLSDIFVTNKRPEYFQNLSARYSFSQEIQAEEILEDIFQYSNSKLSALTSNHHSCSIISFDSGDSYDNVVTACDRQSPETTKPTIKIPKPCIRLDVFLAYFTRRRKSALSPLLQFQLQLQKVSFGVSAWSAVAACRRSQPEHHIATGQSLYAYLATISRDVIYFVSSQNVNNNIDEVTTTDSPSSPPSPRKHTQVTTSLKLVSPTKELELQEIQTVSRRLHADCHAPGQGANGTGGGRKEKLTPSSPSPTKNRPHIPPCVECKDSSRVSFREVITMIFGV